MAPRFNWWIEFPPTILISADPSLTYDEVREKLADFLNEWDELGSKHGIVIEPDYQFDLHEADA